ncbi:OB-fold domain-containing protein [Ancylobacter sp. 6x-1]|uniref:OB-fold domain-containing protein n=1 Tax=Ancylobacter crimeensis TaxID=2579147 RepID=A0ABT0DDU7_9HYPH|nr:OB-fold domain-containing protein [Ancylobacter crimeensis]MCK0198125.1 OB-fold domain-containing protein [Ancylobacter crimeensis]
MMIEMNAILPVKDALTTPWFEAAEQERLLIQRDPTTGKVQMYPRARIAGAPEREPEWVQASGRATLYSFTVVQRSLHPQFAGLEPFVIAMVDLEEGARLTSWIVDVPLEQLRCDMLLRVVFREIHAGLTMPCFTGA